MSEREIDQLSGEALERLLAELRGWRLETGSVRRGSGDYAVEVWQEEWWTDPQTGHKRLGLPAWSSDDAAAWQLHIWLLQQKWCGSARFKRSDAYDRRLDHSCFLIIAFDGKERLGDYEGHAPIDQPKLAQLRAVVKCLLKLREEGKP
jgi:hypothetical protein